MSRTSELLNRIHDTKQGPKKPATTYRTTETGTIFELRPDGTAIGNSSQLNNNMSTEPIPTTESSSDQLTLNEMRDIVGYGGVTGHHSSGNNQARTTEYQADLDHWRPKKK